MPRKIDLKGKRFGRLVVCKQSTDKKPYHCGALWICKCDCGRGTIVESSHLIHEGTLSCGCLRKEKSRERISAYLESKRKRLSDKAQVRT